MITLGRQVGSAVRSRTLRTGGGHLRKRTLYLGRILVITSLMFTVAVNSAVLTEDQIAQAIAYGAQFKTRDKFLDKGLKGVRVKLASAMAMDGISKYATFFNDWNFIAAD